MAMERDAWKGNDEHAKIYKELQHQEKNSFQYLSKRKTTLI